MKKISFSHFFVLAEIFLILLFVFWRFRLTLVRYFDRDEFVHLHWAYSLLAGERPYRDFFYFFPPFFLYPLAFLFLIFGRSVTAMLEARVLMFLFFLGETFTFFFLAKKFKGLFFALLSILTFLFLPLPSDKMMEIRPDVPAYFFAFLGLFFFVSAVEEEKGKKSFLTGKTGYFLSGAAFGLSLFFVPKTFFSLLPVFFAWFYFFWRKLKSRQKDSSFLFFLPSLFLPALIFFLLLFHYGQPFSSFRSILFLSGKMNKILAEKFYMRPDLFFYPNQTYYGLSGYSLPYLLNLIIYLLSSFWAIYRFLVFNLAEKENERIFNFLLVSSFFLNLFAFVFFFPLKHAQYLLPLAPFVAFYFADFWEGGVRKIFSCGNGLFSFLTFFLFFLFALANWQMYREKFFWTNKETLKKIERILQVIPPNERIFDLTGETIFFKNGYFFCCLPYGQYEEVIPFSLPDLKEELERKKVRYVFVGDEKRLEEIPSFQARVLRENFSPSPLEGLWEKKFSP